MELERRFGFDDHAVVYHHVDSLLAQSFPLVLNFDPELACHMVTTRQKLALECHFVESLEKAEAECIVHVEESTDDGVSEPCSSRGFFVISHHHDF